MAIHRQYFSTSEEIRVGLICLVASLQDLKQRKMTRDKAWSVSGWNETVKNVRATHFSFLRPLA